MFILILALCPYIAFWILLTEAIFSKIQPGFFSAQPLCQECLFIYLSSSWTSDRYQNSPFHLKEKVNLKDDIHLATSVWILQFPFWRPSSQFPLLPKATSSLCVIFGEAVHSIQCIAQWDDNIMQWWWWNWFINYEGVIDQINSVLHFPPAVFIWIGKAMFERRQCRWKLLGRAGIFPIAKILGGFQWIHEK